MPLFATCPDVMPTMSHPETQQHGRCVELSPAPPHTPPTTTLQPAHAARQPEADHLLVVKRLPLT